MCRASGEQAIPNRALRIEDVVYRYPNRRGYAFVRDELCALFCGADIDRLIALNALETGNAVKYLAALRSKGEAHEESRFNNRWSLKSYALNLGNVSFAKACLEDGSLKPQDVPRLDDADRSMGAVCHKLPRRLRKRAVSTLLGKRHREIFAKYKKGCRIKLFGFPPEGDIFVREQKVTVKGKAVKALPGVGPVWLLKPPDPNIKQKQMAQGASPRTKENDKVPKIKRRFHAQQFG